MPGRPLLYADRFGVGGLLDRIVGVFGRANTYVELQRHLQRDQEDDNDALVCLAQAYRVPVIATGNNVRFSITVDSRYDFTADFTSDFSALNGTFSGQQCAPGITPGGTWNGTRQ